MTDGRDAHKVRHETVLDTGAEHLGRIYAEALLSAAEKAEASERVVEQLGQVVDDVLANHPALVTVLGSPRVATGEKMRVIERLFGDSVDQVLLQFLKVAARRGRLQYLPYVREAALDLLNEQAGRVVAEVRTAVPLSDELKHEVMRRIGESVAKQVTLREKVDPTLIGGLVIRVGDTLLDASVAGRLNSLASSARTAFARKLVENSERFATAEPAAE